MIQLDDIKGPEILRECGPDDLKNISDQIRERIIDVVSKNGGHLASNLGVVELTVALHSIFSSPRDKIVWDVGHQCYAHKLVTGRQKEFETLRKYRGMSGFPKRNESHHDIVETGHSSTSLSAAMGLAMAREQKGENHEIIAVIGDGALSGGMALEALNHIGHLNKKIIVVLNDNEMSISKNVGALANYLSRIRTEPVYQKLRSDAEFLMKRIPAIGGRMAFAADRIKDSLKYLVLPGVFFEELGFTYLGPVSGHDISALRQYFQRSKRLDGPLLIHAITEKGKGYHPAEKSPSRFHGTGPFILENGEGKVRSSGKSFTSCFSDIICEMAEKDEKIVAITAAMPDGTGLDKFSQKFPDRFFDVGIAEQHGVTLAAGMARGGLKPVVAIYSTFLQRAYDQIIHDVCLPNLPVIFAVDRAGLVGEDGETHHGVFDLSFLRHIPNMNVLAPRDQVELEKMFTWAQSCEGPVAIRYPRGSVPQPPFKSDQPINRGEGEMLRRGKDILLLGSGSMAWDGYKVAEILESKGYSVGVADLRFIKPLDEKNISRWIENVSIVVTLEENYVAGGMGSAILEFMAREKIEKPVLNIGLPDRFITHGNIGELLRENGLDIDNMVDRIEDFWISCSKNQKRDSDYGEKIGPFARRTRAFFFKK